MMRCGKIARALFLFALALLALFSTAMGQNADSYEPNNEMGAATQLSVGQAVVSSIFPAQELSTTARYTKAELDAITQPSDPGTEYQSYYPYKEFPAEKQFNIVPLLMDNEYTAYDGRNTMYLPDGNGIIIQAQTSDRGHFFNGKFKEPFEIKAGDAQWYATIAYVNMNPAITGTVGLMLADQNGNAVTVPLLPGQVNPVPGILGLPLQGDSVTWATQVPLKMPAAGEGFYTIHNILFGDVSDTGMLQDGTKFRVVVELTQWPIGEDQRGKIVALEMPAAPVASAQETGSAAPQKSPGMGIVEMGLALLGLRAALNRVPGNVTRRLSGYYDRLRSSRSLILGLSVLSILAVLSSVNPAAAQETVISASTPTYEMMIIAAFLAVVLPFGMRSATVTDIGETRGVSIKRKLLTLGVLTTFLASMLSGLGVNMEKVKEKLAELSDSGGGVQALKEILKSGEVPVDVNVLKGGFGIASAQELSMTKVNGGQRGSGNDDSGTMPADSRRLVQQRHCSQGVHITCSMFSFFTGFT